MRKFLFLLALLSQLSEVSLLFSLDSSKAITQYRHDAWSTDDGLPLRSIQAAIQTSEGYLWFGTQAGAVRFDGVDFTLFNKNDVPEIENDDILSLFEDNRRNLWIGTGGGGVNRLTNGKFTHFSKKDGLASDFVNSIYQDTHGALWFGTNGGGLSRFENGKFKTYTTEDGLSNNVVRCIYGDRAGNLWIGTEKGLSVFKDGKFVVYTTHDGLPNDFIECIYQDSQQRLWIGANGGGLVLFQNGSFKKYGARQGLSNEIVRSILQDRAGNLWIGTNGGGLFRFENESFTSYNSTMGLSDDIVFALLEDQEGSLWIGTYNGLNRFSDGDFTSYTTSEGLSDNAVFAVCDSQQGGLWIATEKGLSLLQGRKITSFTTERGLPSNFVYSLYDEPNNGLWIGTYGAGLSHFKNGVFTTYTTRDGLANNVVNSIFPAREGGLWLGTRDGLSRFNNGKFTSYTGKEGLANNFVLPLLEESGGVLWVGTYAGGLNRFENGAFVHYGIKEGLSNDVVMSLYEDSEGTLWIGTYGGGLNRLKNGKFTRYDKAGLVDDVVYSIVEAQGYLWMGGNRGVSRVSKEELSEVADGGLKTASVRMFGKADGMKAGECNGGGHPAAWKTRDGKLWFASTGVAMVDPQNLHINKRLPPVLIEQFLVDRRQVKDHSPFLRAGSRDFEIHYTALSFLAPEKVKFKYKMEGYDPAWIDAGTRRVAYYTNLAPANYRFRVIACNNDGLWNETGAAYSFVLQPYFYQTRWFYVLCAIAIGIATWAGYRVRLSQIKARFAAVLEERTRMAREIHDTLAQGITGISLQLEGAKETLRSEPVQAEKHLTLARGLIRSSLSEARMLVWNLRSPAAGSDLAASVRNISKQLSSATNLDVEFETRGNPYAIPVDAEAHFLRIVQEAMTNAAKHARATAMRIELTYSPDEICMKLRDNGSGFDPANSRSAKDGHFGLMGMKERAAKMRGTLSIQSSPGMETEITVRIPSSENERRQ